MEPAPAARKRRGRPPRLVSPPGATYAQIAIKIPVEERDRLFAIAHARGTTVKDLIRALATETAA